MRDERGLRPRLSVEASVRPLTTARSASYGIYGEAMNTHEPLNPQPEPVTSKGSAIITRVAGTGVAGDTGDNGPATEAQLNTPTGLEVIPGGGFLFSDSGNNVVRHVSPEGVITRVAGTGAAGDTGDGGPATQAQLNAPGAMTALPGGGFLFSDLGNNVVRQVSRDGVITRVAGTGAGGDTGDGGPATRAELNRPSGVAVLPGGGFLVADNGNNVVRQVSRDGVITRVAGTGAAGDTGDGGPATEAQLNGPGVWGCSPAAGSYSPMFSTMWCAKSRRIKMVRTACEQLDRPPP